MKKIKSYLSILTCSLILYTSLAQECKMPTNLNDLLVQAVKNEKFNKENLSEINEILFELEALEQSKHLKYCSTYSENINHFFYSENEEKRNLSYHLIGASNDNYYNEELLNRIKSNENSALKTWSAYALLSNKYSKASDDIFLLLSSTIEDLPIGILADGYVRFDPNAVKQTSWKYIDSENRDQQILAVQCLSYYEKDEKLQAKLLNFLETWDNESKGWIISSMSQQKMSNLKPILEKYVHIENLKNVIIYTLKNSPTKSDQKFAKQLENK